MIRRLTSLAFALAAAVLCGCTFPMGGATLVSATDTDLEAEVAEADVEGQDCVHWLLFVPLGHPAPNLEVTLNEALEQAEGNVLTDVAVYNDWIFTGILNRSCIRVVGDVGVLQ